MTDLITMYDSLDVGAIPRDATMVAGYVNGSFPTWREVVAQFPHARKVSITVNASVLADVLDVENGDATPSQVPGWVTWARSHNLRPVVYANTSTWPGIVAECKVHGVTPPFWWSASWNGHEHLDEGAVATQWASPAVPPEGTAVAYDVSAVTPNWPARPALSKGPHMTIPKLTWATFYRAVALVGAVLGYVIGIGNQLHLPPAIRTAIIAAASGIAWIEHHKVTAAKPPKPPAPTS